MPAICRKKVSVAFDGGLLSSDGGVLVLRDVERHLGLAADLTSPARVIDGDTIAIGSTHIRLYGIDVPETP